MPDFDPGDLQRIEVLRGPQGTLYGASSVGGLLNFVTVDPSPAGVSGRLEAGGNSVQNGSELGYTFRGSVNVPLSSDFAVRASAFTREDPGYIDDPVLDLKGVNEDRASGGHLAALWQPSETFSLKLSALYQKIKGTIQTMKLRIRHRFSAWGSWGICSNFSSAQWILTATTEQRKPIPSSSNGRFGVADSGRPHRI